MSFGMIAQATLFHPVVVLGTQEHSAKPLFHHLAVIEILGISPTRVCAITAVALARQTICFLLNVYHEHVH
jgi:hypothetical protein